MGIAAALSARLGLVAAGTALTVPLVLTAAVPTTANGRWEPVPGDRTPQPAAAHGSGAAEPAMPYYPEWPTESAESLLGPETGATPWQQSEEIEGYDDPNAAKQCPVRNYPTACVDQNRQIMWVQKSAQVQFGPVPVRTGAPGQETRNGWHRVYWRSEDHYSAMYDAYMPYAQFFDGGQAFHAAPGDIHTPPGSHGSVNLRLKDAKRLWDLLKADDRVYVWGRRPET